LDWDHLTLNQQSAPTPWYAARHLIDNFFCWVKQFRAIATRYDKTARNFQAAFQMVAALCWLN
jgi:transposase